MLLGHLEGFLGLGYLFSMQQNYPESGGTSIFIHESLAPVTRGMHNNSVMFKLAVKYNFMNKAALEAAYGSYDVFNPYSLNTPITQLSGEYELTSALSFTSYVRYQYQYNLFRPYNYFFSIGIVYHGR